MDVLPRLIRFALLSAFLGLGASSLAAQESPNPPGAKPENQAVTDPAATDDAGTAEDDAAAAEEGEPVEANARKGRRAEASEAEVAELRGRVEEAFGKGDEEVIGQLFTRKSVFLPLTGEALEGVKDIRRHLGDAPRPASFVMRSQRTDQIGRVVIDTGSITLAEAGGQTVEAEYVLIARAARDGMEVLHLAMFPARQAAAQ